MIDLAREVKTLVQCDFDGTVTIDDVSFKLLDAYADKIWRQLFSEYEDGKMTVGQFNRRAFSMVKADKESLLEVAREHMITRPGFRQMVDSCRKKGFRFVIVSNGLAFNIEEILKDIGLVDIEIFAAQTHFQPEGLQVQYIGPDGNPLDKAFKDIYANFFLRQGYRVIYVGNGTSDLSPARKCHHVFATGTLLKHCKRTNLTCTPFEDFNEMVSVLERL